MRTDTTIHSNKFGHFSNKNTMGRFSNSQTWLNKMNNFVFVIFVCWLWRSLWQSRLHFLTISCILVQSELFHWLGYNTAWWSECEVIKSMCRATAAGSACWKVFVSELDTPRRETIAAEDCVQRLCGHHRGHQVIELHRNSRNHHSRHA